MIEFLAQFVLTTVTFCIMGLIVGTGVVLARKRPELSEFLKQRPILGWTIAFTAGGAIFSLAMSLFKSCVLLILESLR